MSKYYNKKIPTEIHFIYGSRNSGKTYYEFNKIKEENERLKAEIDLLNDNRHYLNNKIGKAIIFIRKNIELNNGALSNREELIVSKHDLIKNETDVLNYLINILKGEE
jgi:hypothetical protein